MFFVEYIYFVYIYIQNGRKKGKNKESLWILKKLPNDMKIHTHGFLGRPNDIMQNFQTFYNEEKANDFKGRFYPESSLEGTKSTSCKFTFQKN